MKRNIFAAVILNYLFASLIYCNQENINNSYFEASFFDQKLTHLNKQNNQTWKQVKKFFNKLLFHLLLNHELNIKKYFVNEQYFNGQGPVFLIIGDEQAAKPEYIAKGFWITQAKRFV